jgi:Trk K+ transport system NAD-binding subunit
MPPDRRRRLPRGGSVSDAILRRLIRPRRSTSDGQARSADVATHEHYVVYGEAALAYRVVEALVMQWGRRVTVIVRSRRVGHGPAIAALPGVDILEVSATDLHALRTAGVHRATALAVLGDDEADNLITAELARELNPDLRLIVRVADPDSIDPVWSRLGDAVLLSTGAIAAPGLAASVGGEAPPLTIQLDGRTLAVGRLSTLESDRRQVICGLADTRGEVVDLLPDSARCDLVLATTTARLAPGGTRRNNARRVPMMRLLWAQARLMGGLHRLAGSMISGSLLVITVILIGLLGACAAVLWRLRPALSFWQAAYLVLLDAVGGVNADLALSRPEKLVQASAAVIGLAIVPVATGMVVQSVVRARATLTIGLPRGPVRDHIVVVGLGEVGAHVVRHLRRHDVPVVAVDKSEDSIGVEWARAAGVPVVIGDPARHHTLQAAFVPKAAAVIAATPDDAENVAIALRIRVMNKQIAVVLRIFDGDFAEQVAEGLGFQSSVSASRLAAPVFIGAMLGLRVVATIPVGRRLLAMVDFPVAAGSWLDGIPVSEVESTRDLRVIAITPAGHGDVKQWRPPPDRVLRPTDQLVLVATSAGLRRLSTSDTPRQPAASVR